MTRLVLLILLLTVVYSWEELKYVLVVIWSKLRNKKTIYEKFSETDDLVADIVLVATVPLSLAYLILNPGSLPLKLFIILAEFVGMSLLLKGLEEYRWRRRFTKDSVGTNKIIAIAFSLIGLVSPSWRFASNAARSTTRISRYLLTLAIPLTSGLGLAIAAHRLGSDEFQSRLDPLIAVATLGLVLNATIEILEHTFKSNNIRLLSFARIILGIALIFVLARI